MTDANSFEPGGCLADNNKPRKEAAYAEFSLNTKGLHAGVLSRRHVDWSSPQSDTDTHSLT